MSAWSNTRRSLNGPVPGTVPGTWLVRPRPRLARVILENGLIRTLDPQIPTQRALAIAGELVAGGVGVHETALASPEVVDLGGRVVLPGFTDSHVHFPTWAMAQTEVKLDGCASLDDALDRIRAPPRPPRPPRGGARAGRGRGAAGLGVAQRRLVPAGGADAARPRRDRAGDS